MVTIFNTSTATAQLNNFAPDAIFISIVILIYYFIIFIFHLKLIIKFYFSFQKNRIGEYLMFIYRSSTTS